MEIVTADANKKFGNPHFTATVSGYGLSLESEAADDIERTREAPQLTLQAVDDAVVFIERNIESRSYGGAKFSLVPWTEEIPWSGPPQELVFAENQRARRIHDDLSNFYHLLRTAEFWASNYSVRIEAARQALFTVYPHSFQAVPPSDYTLSDGESELEACRKVTQQVWPSALRFNGVVDKIAEVVSGNSYQSKIARENAKLKQRARSAIDLIDGLLDHHESLTVVAVRLSILQEYGRDFIGDKMHKALRTLIGDRRNDNYLNQAVGYFWVLQESFRVNKQKSPPTSNKLEAVKGTIALHYDLVMFFDAIHRPDTENITGHIGARWRHITGKLGRCQRLSGKDFTPHFDGDVLKALKRTQQLPTWAEISGLVEKGSQRASLLRGYTTYMVASALLRKPPKPVGTLIKSNTRRFGKSDLDTGLGFDKPGRGNKSGNSGTKHERKKRPKYVALPPGT